MPTLTRLVQFVFLIGIFLIRANTLFAQDADLIRHFDYDQKAPLGTKQVGVQHRDGATVYDITYASPEGGAVPAYLVVPKGKGPFAAVIWGHWYWENSSMRNRRQFLDEAVVLAQAGVVSLLPDGPVARPGHVESRVNTVGAFLSGIDRRFKAFVLMAGTLSDEVDLKSKEYRNYRQKIGPGKFDAFIAKYYWMDEGKYVAHAAPAFVFLQYASQEKFLNPDRACEYEKIVSEPKLLKIYDAPHALSAEARRDRIQFLSEQLKLKPLPAALIASIPNLYQPPDQ